MHGVIKKSQKSKKNNNDTNSKNSQKYVFRKIWFLTA